MTRLVQVAVAAVVMLAVAGTAVAQSKFVPPVRGEVEVGVLSPVTKVDEKTKMVITTIKVKNLSATGSVAGLKVEEYWYDKANNPVTGSRARLPKPLLPGEVATLTLETPRDPKMHRNQYLFSHANGKVKTKTMKTF
ncbi:MAG: hypothetical protein Q7V01_13480 [Vicinamibacterales bacterium]|nr:hypothetical protein [Vicinamibacterales bacterium]